MSFEVSKSKHHNEIRYVVSDNDSTTCETVYGANRIYFGMVSKVLFHCQKKNMVKTVKKLVKTVRKYDDARNKNGMLFLAI